MVKYLVAILGITFVCGAMSVTARAEVLRDPTTPPAAFMPEATQAGAETPVLQSVMLGQQQKAAIISGKLVQLGKPYEQYVLVKLSETEAVLRAEDGANKVLKMQFMVEKRPANQALRSASVNKLKTKAKK